MTTFARSLQDALNARPEPSAVRSLAHDLLTQIRAEKKASGDKPLPPGLENEARTLIAQAPTVLSTADAAAIQGIRRALGWNN